MDEAGAVDEVGEPGEAGVYERDEAGVREPGEDRVRGDLEWGTIPGLVRAAARRYGAREAVVDGRSRVGYAELGERIERAAAACLATGIRAGDRVAIWAPNSLDWIVSALGAVTAGAVLVP